MTKRITWGADPEVFLRDQKTGEFVPVCGLLGGTKKQPRVVGDHYGMQEDNVAAEFTIPVCESFRDVILYTNHGLELVLASLSRKGLAIYNGCQVRVPLPVLEAIGPPAMEFGCVPDFSAYEMGLQFPIVRPASLIRDDGTAVRFAGGHIHIGYNAATEMDAHVAAMFADATIGVMLVEAGEVQGERRALYGQPGRYRPTKYGIEYRTPSNGWCLTRNLRDAAHTGANRLRSIMLLPTEEQYRLYNEVPWSDVHSGISSENRAMCGQVREWLERRLSTADVRNAA